MKENISPNEINNLLAQMSDWIYDMYLIYCTHYSEAYKLHFLKVLVKLPHNEQRYVFDVVTNYSAHHRCGERAKQYPQDARLRKIVEDLYNAYDADPKHIAFHKHKAELEEFGKKYHNCGDSKLRIAYSYARLLYNAAYEEDNTLPVSTIEEYMKEYLIKNQEKNG